MMDPVAGKTPCSPRSNEVPQVLPSIRYAVIASFMGQLKDRFHTYGDVASVGDKLGAIAQVPGATGVEIVYPYELKDLESVKRVLEETGLSVSSVNLNVKAEPVWRDGSFTSSDPVVRRRAVQWLKEAMDVAAEVGAYLVTTAPLNDGFEYAFEMDYMRAWQWLVEGIREGAFHRPDVRVSVEYKASEPRSHVILDSAAKSLLLCQQVGLPNVGVTMDMGHALYAGESTAQSASLLSAFDRLFLVHVNDNYRNWDWDLVPGSINFWDMVELFYYLRRTGYQGWMVADVFPARVNRIEAFGTTFRMLRVADELVQYVGLDRLTMLIESRQPLQALCELVAPLEKALGLESSLPSPRVAGKAS